jgi:hypothetical protein
MKAFHGIFNPSNNLGSCPKGEARKVRASDLMMPNENPIPFFAAKCYASSSVYRKKTDVYFTKSPFSLFASSHLVVPIAPDSSSDRSSHCPLVGLCQLRYMVST